jgi:NAD(P)H-hydrate repair Nnr-like enzyme with NAD(P)H-hydrate dehydratase domain
VIEGCWPEARPRRRASAGAYVHGLAGILAGRALGEGTLASDVVAHLPAAVNRVLEGM